MKKVAYTLIVIGIALLLFDLLVAVNHIENYHGSFLFFHFKLHGPVKGFYNGIDFILAGVFTLMLYQERIDYKFAFVLAFVLATLLKIARYEYYLAPGYDLGNYTSILYNISHHFRAWDGLNQVNAFAGHIRPFLFPLSLVFLIWSDPRLLLVLQSLLVMLTIPVLSKLSDLYKLDIELKIYVIVLFLSNIYVHWVNGADFHLESFAIPLILLGIYYLEKGNNTAFILTMLTTLTFKEDIAITWVSVGLFYWIIRKNFRKSLLILLPSFLYGLFALLLMSHFTQVSRMAQAHYSGLPRVSNIVISLLRFFSSSGFIPLLYPAGLIAYVLPLSEHIVSSRPQHFNIFYQYSANLLPVVFWAILLYFKNKKPTSHIRTLVILAIFVSVFQNPVNKYIDLSKIKHTKKAYLDRVVSSIRHTPVSSGNHISPHLAARDHSYQFPVVKDAEIIVLDTTWHDFTPVSLDSGYAVLRSIEENFRVEPAPFGILILKRINP